MAWIGGLPDLLTWKSAGCPFFLLLNLYTVVGPTVNVLYFRTVLILQTGQICENKSLAKIDNPNTLINKNLDSKN